VVLDYVGVTLADEGAEIGYELRFVRFVRRFENLHQPLRIPDGNHEDPSPLRTERRCLEIELEPVKIGVDHIAKVGAPRRHQILLHRPDPVVILLDIIQASNRLAESLRGAGKDCPFQRAPIVRREDISI
jgi:hypothetical protein